MLTFLLEADPNYVFVLCSDMMINSCQVTCQSIQDVITQPTLYNLPSDSWNRHSDCKQSCLSITVFGDHDSTWSSITSRNGIVIKAVYARILYWFCGLTAKPVADCKLLAFDQCVTVKSPSQDCMKEARNDVSNIHDGKNKSSVGETLWGNTRVFHLPIWIISQRSFLSSYQRRVGHLFESMFAGYIVFFRWLTVSLMSHVFCDEIAQVWLHLYIMIRNCKQRSRCQEPTTHHSMLNQVLAGDCNGFRIKGLKHHIIGEHLHRSQFPNNIWWIDSPKDFPIGEASNPGPE